MGQTEAQKRAKKKYDDKTAFRVGLKLNNLTDGEVIEKLKSVENKQQYIKELILADIGREKSGQD